jgi:hypothetical protein
MKVFAKYNFVIRIIGRDLSVIPILIALLSTITYTNISIDKTMAVQIPSIENLWVDANNGNDENTGLTQDMAFRSIQRAANIAQQGTTVHILPGIYRETVQPRFSGSATKSIVYRAENGPGTVFILGSEKVQTLEWTQLTTNSIGLPPTVNPQNIYYTDLSAWALNDSPRFVVDLNSDSGEVTRLPLAREPDWIVTTEWKYAENWWAAEGGASIAMCDPSTNVDHDCDISSRSTIQLIDRSNDTDPAGIESGNLTTLGNLIGATLVALDTDEGHYVYRRVIVSHDVSIGKITVDRPCEFDAGSDNPGLGWGSKYYVENHPALLDTPGEWWYDPNSDRLYLWPLILGNPATTNIEISRREIGFDLTNLSYIILDGVNMEFYNNSAIYQDNNDESHSYHNIVRQVTLYYTDIGIDIGQGAGGPTSNRTDGLIVENSTIAHMDTNAIQLNYWWPGGTADTFTHAGIVNTAIHNNEFYDLGFRSDGDNAIGIVFFHPDRLRFSDNYIHQVAQNGVAFSWSIIQASENQGFSDEEIKTGDILIENNTFENACLLNADCGELKILGRKPGEHIFRNVLITGNVFKNTTGWTYISEKRGRWSDIANSDIRGMGGFGLYLDNASGVHVYRNIAYNNANTGFMFYEYWWDGDLIFYNNVSANSLIGLRLDGHTQSSVNTQIANNILVNNAGYGILIYQAQPGYGNFYLDHDLYFNNGWQDNTDDELRNPGDMALYNPNRFYQTLYGIQVNTAWEGSGVEGDPYFWFYDYSDHNLFDDSWPDFHLTSASNNALDMGSAVLPNSLTYLLYKYQIIDYHRGQAFDIGRFEGGFSLHSSPVLQPVHVGNSAQYFLRIDPINYPGQVAITAFSTLPLDKISLSSPVFSNQQAITLTIEVNSMEAFLPQTLYAINIEATGDGFTDTTQVYFFLNRSIDHRLYPHQNRRR